MGRTGTLHACEQDGIAPDLMTIAKGLGAGYQPIGAVLLMAMGYDMLSMNATTLALRNSSIIWRRRPRPARSLRWA